MIVEVIAVGTELLLGQIVNGNAAHIGRRLAEAGFDSLFSTVVGDNLERVANTITVAIERADAVVITGGIGPTQDDLTREAISRATGRPMLFNDEYANRLREFWGRRGRKMPESNLRQAEYPEGAEQIDNPKGTAPALALQHEGCWIFALPGVPQEMELFLDEHVIPRMERAVGADQVLVSRLFRSWGRSESDIAELLDDLYQGSTNPSVAFLASGGEIKVRVTAKAQDEEAARKMIDPLEDVIRGRLGSSVFGADADTIEVVVFRLLRERGWTLGTAESATGGLISARITSVPGASAVFRGAVVSYATDLKRSMLDVPPEVLAEGVVSPDTAMFMADGAAELLNCDVAVAVSGSAGPDPQERPVGTMVIAVRTPEATRARVLRLPGDRERIRTYATTASLHMVRLAIMGEWWTE